jgi:hypothetical protein
MTRPGTAEHAEYAENWAIGDPLPASGFLRGVVVPLSVV